MDNVIRWEDKAGPRAARAQTPGHSADIIIFPGVRFERLTDEMLAAKSSARSRRLPALQNSATAEDLHE